MKRDTNEKREIEKEMMQEEREEKYRKAEKTRRKGKRKRKRKRKTKMKMKRKILPNIPNNKLLIQLFFELIRGRVTFLLLFGIRIVNVHEHLLRTSGGTIATNSVVQIGSVATITSDFPPVTSSITARAPPFR